MKNITMIAAIGRNGELGKNNQLIWSLKKDLKFFKEQTMGKPIVMGRKTLESLPKMLPGRQHIVLTHSNLEVDPSIIVIHSKQELLDFIEQYQKEVMIIGGASIYQTFLEDANKLILTEIDAEDKKADVYFPYFNKSEWNREEIGHGEENTIHFKHMVYTKKK